MTVTTPNMHRCGFLAALFMVALNGQAIMSFRVQVRAVDRNGDALSKVRIAMLPVVPETTPLPRCVYPFCERVSPGSYTLLVASENKLTIQRIISISQYDRVIYAEMAPLIIVEPNLPGLRSVVVPVNVREDERSEFTVRLIGVLNQVIRSEPVVDSVVEFPKVISGRYLLLLLRHGKAVACNVVWHDDGSVTREALTPGKSGCDLHF